MAPDDENFRGINAVRVWSTANNLNMDKVIEGGYTRYLPAFDDLVPALVKAWEKKGFLPDSLAGNIEAAVDLLKKWDRQSEKNSVPATLGIEWAQRLLQGINRAEVPGMPEAGFVEKTRAFAANATPDELLFPLATTISDLKRRFGYWEVPWGEINRYQRLTGKLNETYSDTMPSIPARFAAATWGALPSFVSRPMNGSSRRYGYSGNSFICAVEFGDKVKAKSLLAGGNSNNPSSKHFGDQAEMYASGVFKDVLYYKEDVLKRAVKTYKPGQ
jgi:acyl-homoserine lactone acylase PvdQ